MQQTLLVSIANNPLLNGRIAACFSATTCIASNTGVNCRETGAVCSGVPSPCAGDPMCNSCNLCPVGRCGGFANCSIGCNSCPAGTSCDGSWCVPNSVACSSGPCPCTNATDVAAIYTLRQDFLERNPAWTNVNWPAHVPISDFQGVLCGYRSPSHRVTIFELQSSGIFTGPFPDPVGALEELRYFNLPGFSGAFPLSYAQLTKLETWRSGDSSVGGAIPTWINGTTFPNLREFECPNCALYNSVPLSFSTLGLTVLVLNNNAQLTGPIDWVGNMNALVRLHIQTTGMTGIWPDNLFQNLTNFNELIASGSIGFYGPLPSSLFMRNMGTVLLNQIPFSGPIPGTLTRVYISNRKPKLQN